jgi:esterase/lipase superfamily enzyme
MGVIASATVGHVAPKLDAASFRAACAALVVCATALFASAPPVQGQPVAASPALPDACKTEASENLRQLEAKKERLEREIAGKGGRVTSGPTPGNKESTAGLREAQADLIEVMFRIECLRSPPAPAPVTRGVRPTGGAAPGQIVEVTTYYATNRNSVGGTIPASMYGTRVESRFTYGRAVVTIPPNHTAGNIELPSLWKLEREPDPKKHFVLKSVSPLNADAARKEMAEKAAKSPAMLIFVHGYNTGFADAALRTAQMAYDLRFPGMAFFFSWPSARTIRGYWQDEEAARLSEGIFAQLLEELSQLPVTDIYVVAHSMGSRVVGHGIQALAEKGKVMKNLREVLFAAPDMNVDLFRNLVAPKLAAMQGTRTTIYASSTDLALIASKIVHGFRRVGETAGGVFTYQGLETIDASKAPGATRGYGHHYLVDSPPVVKDIQTIIERKVSAKLRGLGQVGAPPSLYFLLK